MEKMAYFKIGRAKMELNEIEKIHDGVLSIKGAVR